MLILHTVAKLKKVLSFDKLQLVLRGTFVYIEHKDACQSVTK
jgi:hypothetical protein